MSDKVEKVMNEWDNHLQDVLDRYSDDPTKGAIEMRETLLAQQWLNKLYRATINGDAPKQRRKRTVKTAAVEPPKRKRRKRRTKAEMEAARAADVPNGPQAVV